PAVEDVALVQIGAGIEQTPHGGEVAGARGPHQRRDVAPVDAPGADGGQRKAEEQGIARHEPRLYKELVIVKYVRKCFAYRPASQVETAGACFSRSARHVSIRSSVCASARVAAGKGCAVKNVFTASRDRASQNAPVADTSRTSPPKTSAFDRNSSQ